jgi:hypothetical protein
MTTLPLNRANPIKETPVQSRASALVQTDGTVPAKQRERLALSPLSTATSHSVRSLVRNQLPIGARLEEMIHIAITHEELR